MAEVLEDGTVSVVDLVAGAGWRAAALRAAGAFLLGYIALPLIIGRAGHGVNFVQFAATALAFLLCAVALFRLMRQPATQEIIPLTSPAHAPEPVGEEALWTDTMLRSLPPMRLELLAAAYYREKGIRVDAAPQKSWGGLMLRLFQDQNEEATSLVRCKAGDGHPVERRQIEELLRAMVENATPKGFFIAPDGFSEEATRLARSAHITPIDDLLLLSMLNRLPTKARQRMQQLAQVATAAETTPPAAG